MRLHPKIFHLRFFSFLVSGSNLLRVSENDNPQQKEKAEVRARIYALRQKKSSTTGKFFASSFIFCSCISRALFSRIYLGRRFFTGKSAIELKQLVQRLKELEEEGENASEGGFRRSSSRTGSRRSQLLSSEDLNALTSAPSSVRRVPSTRAASLLVVLF